MQDNKLIAEFMGYRVFGNKCRKPMPYSLKGWLVDDIAPMQFHTSWDWLMPVIIKCKESIDYCSDDNALKYHNIEDEMLSQLSIEDTHKAVVEFIKEYNDENRYICCSCGEHCSEYTYSEDRDADECNDCKTSNDER